MGGQVNKDFCSLVRDFCISNDEYVGVGCRDSPMSSIN